MSSPVLASPSRKRPDVEPLSDGTKKLIGAIVSEFLGTLFLIFVAVGIQANERQYFLDATDAQRVAVQGPAYVLTIALGWGATYAVLTEALVRMSGAHFNPAITIAAVVARRVSPPLGLLYIAAQCVGGICGALMISGMADSTTYGNIGKVGITTTFNSGEIFGIELISTAIVVLVWMSLADPRLFPYGQHRKQVGAPSYIGAAYFVTVLLTSRWDRSGLNPVRALGPAVATGDFQNQWVYWIGPIMGGLLGMLIHEIFAFFNPYPQYEPRFFHKKIDTSHTA
jgi:aquaporin PIP